MKELNPVKTRPARGYPIECPDVREFTLHGKRIALDVNTLAVARLDGDEVLNGWGCAEKPQFRGLGDCTSARKIVLNVTHACNLACRYCFAADYQTMPSMTPETACRAVDRLFAPQHDINLAFFGGEPLLAWETMLAVIVYASTLAKARRVKAHFHITTNGTLLDADKVEIINRHGCSILLSMDGPKELHNAWRPARKADTDSHGASIAGLTLLRKADAGSRVTIRATYPLSDPRLLERLRYFARIQDNGAISGFSVEPAIMTEGCAVSDEDGIFPDSLRAEYHDAAQWYVGRLKARKPTGYFHFRKLLQRLLTRQVSATECGAGCGYLTVGPDGSIFACHREEGTRIGHVDTGIDEALRCAWRDNRYYQRPACVACWLRHACGGGCRQILAEQGRPLSEIYPARCAMMETIVRECLWILSQVEHDILTGAVGAK